MFDPVPEDDREMYTHWRGLSLARLALELSKGSRSLNLDGGPVHFADKHSYALNTAHSISIGSRITQTRGKGGDISNTLGREFDPETPHPALVVALEDATKHHFTPSDIGAQHGLTTYSMLSALDPSSKSFIEDYFKIKI